MTENEILTKMKIDMELRNMADKTKENYIRNVRKFHAHFGKTADEMGENEISQFLHFQITERKLSASTVNRFNGTLRFLYGVTLDRILNQRKIPYLKEIRSLPYILTKDELIRIFNCAESLQYCAIFNTIYGSGLRVSEVVNLKIENVDSVQMHLIIRNGKNGHDRHALLPKKTLEVLRNYWKLYQPEIWLFPNAKGLPLNEQTVREALNRAAQKAGIDKKVTPHMLRHAFATHLLNAGEDLFHIKRALGHTSIRATAWYLQLSDSQLAHIQSPLDSMEGY